ncbi:MAG: RES domain-containing protein [Pseudomonadota bacterium]
MTAWRIGDPAGRFPVWSAEGARLAKGRWHEAGAAVIYAAEYFSTAMLEKLAHANGVMPPNQHSLKITLPAGLSYEVVNAHKIPGWDSRDGEAARLFGRSWYREKRSATLFVPSVVARGERNLVINADHPDFAKIKTSLETPVAWDLRLFTT